MRYGAETRDYTVRIRLVSDRPVVTLERVSANVTKGEDAKFRLRLLAPWSSDVKVNIVARDTTGRGPSEARLASNPNWSFILYPGREREHLVAFKTRDDDWREEASDIIAWVVPRDDLFVVNREATARVFDNDAGVRRRPPHAAARPGHCRQRPGHPRLGPAAQRRLADYALRVPGTALGLLQQSLDCAGGRERRMGPDRERGDDARGEGAEERPSPGRSVRIPRARGERRECGQCLTL